VSGREKEEKGMEEGVGRGGGAGPPPPHARQQRRRRPAEDEGEGSAAACDVAPESPGEGDAREGGNWATQLISCESYGNILPPSHKKRNSSFSKTTLMPLDRSDYLIRQVIRYTF
jgi:hypothetical protein